MIMMHPCAGVVPSAQTKVVAEADKELESRMTRLQERLVSRDASARKYKVSKPFGQHRVPGCFHTIYC